MSRLTRLVALAALPVLLAGCGSSGGEEQSEAEAAPVSTTQEATVCDDPCMELLQQTTAAEACFEAGESLCLDSLTDVMLTAMAIVDDPSPAYAALTSEYAFAEFLKAEQLASESASELQCYEKPADDAECREVVGESIARYAAGAKALATGVLPLD